MYVTVPTPLHADAREPEYDCEETVECWYSRGDAPDVPPVCPCGHTFTARERRRIEDRIYAEIEGRRKRA